MKGFNLALLISLSIIVCGLVLYHFVAKTSSKFDTPFELIAIAYFTGLILVLSVGYATENLSLTQIQNGKVILAGIFLGIAVAMIELGYIFSYRQGLPISFGMAVVLSITSIILIPVGLLFFNESLEIKKFIGILVALLGVYLLTSS